MYVYMYMYMCVYVYIYIYICICVDLAALGAHLAEAEERGPAVLCAAVEASPYVVVLV